MSLIALTRAVSSGMAHCELTYQERVEIDIELARRQHAGYMRALEELGCKVIELPEQLELPDSVFVEDTALVLDEIAVMLRPGAASRRAEVATVAEALKPYRELLQIEEPGTIDGGDILRIAKNVFVGISQRSNREGIDQLSRLVEWFGYRVIPVAVHGYLHLKSAITQIGPEAVLINPQWVNPTVFKKYRQVKIDPAEPHAANALLVGEGLIYSASHVRTQSRLEKFGLCLRLVDVSEMEKAEGAVTCCSILLKDEG